MPRLCAPEFGTVSMTQSLLVLVFSVAPTMAGG
jgi:hypothetical protein